MPMASLGATISSTSRIVFDTRTPEQRKALFRRIAELLGESPGIRGEDVFVTVLTAAKENWSVGHGLAQFA
jgi:4-oxalocrotonate tautomerase